MWVLDAGLPRHRRMRARSLPGCREDARFLYKRIPRPLAASDPRLQTAFCLLQHLWQHDFAGAWPLLHQAWAGPELGLAQATADRLRRRVTALVGCAYSTLALGQLAAMLGLQPAQAAESEHGGGGGEEGPM